MQDAAEFVLHIAGPLPEKRPLPAIPLGPNVALSFESELNGGWSNANIGIPEQPGIAYEALQRAFLPVPADVVPLSHVEIRAGGAVVWEGRATGDMLVGGEIRGIRATGYGFTATIDNWNRDAGTVHQATTATLLRDAIAKYAPLLSVGTIEDPGRNHFPGDYYRMTPFQMLEAMAREGGGANGNEWMWTVYHRTLTFVERTATTAMYAPPIDATMSIQREYDPYSHASMYFRLQNSGAAEEVLSPEYTNISVSDQGITRYKLVEGGASSASGATQYVQTFLNRVADPIANITIERKAWRGLELATTGERAPWLVRAGEWVSVPPLGLFPILQTRFDAVTGDSTFTLGQPLRRSWNGIIRRIVQTDAHVRNALDVETGMRWGR